MIHKVKIKILILLAFCAFGISGESICTSGKTLTESGAFFCSVDEESKLILPIRFRVKLKRKFSGRDDFVIHYLTEALISNGITVVPDQRVRFPLLYFGLGLRVSEKIFL